jgi:hypothetical protein
LSRLVTVKVRVSQCARTKTMTTVLFCVGSDASAANHHSDVFGTSFSGTPVVSLFSFFLGLVGINSIHTLYF